MNGRAPTSSRWAATSRTSISQPLLTRTAPSPELGRASGGFIMLGRIALFELRYQLRRPIAWFSILIFTGLTFGLVSLGARSSVAFAANTPFRIAAVISSIGILAMLVSIAKLADVA